MKKTFFIASSTPKPQHLQQITTFYPKEEKPSSRYPPGKQTKKIASTSQHYLQSRNIYTPHPIKTKTRYHLYSMSYNLQHQIEKQLKQKQQKILNDIYSKKQPNNHYHYGVVHPIKKHLWTKPINLSSTIHRSSSLSLTNSRGKITDQYFGWMDNIRMAEKLLMAKPSKNMSKLEHQQFFNQHQKYKKNIQARRTVMLKQKMKVRNRM